MEKGSLLLATLIVKDEAKTIKRTLDSVVDHVDGIVVMDTGSVDGTPEIVLGYSKAVLVRDTFVDYATARNKVLDAARQYEPAFTLTLSADETLVGGAELRAFLDAHRSSGDGAYCIMMRSGPRQWPFPRVLRSTGGWRFVNTSANLNEQPYGPAGEVVGPLVPGAFVVHQESDPSRKAARLRERDLPALTAEVEDESKSIALRAESMFQLAETHFVLGYNEPKDADGQRELGGRWMSHFFSAMALYSRYAEVAEAIAAKMKEAGEADWQYLFQRAMYARLMYCQVAETFGLFEPPELVKRLALIVGNAPMLPEAHWALAKNAAKVDVRKAIPLAMRAAKVARAVYEKPVMGPTDTTLEWQSLLLAAHCARMIKDTRLMRSFADQAEKAGAPKQDIEALTLVA